jgi:ABC-type branched-subunit amino acid transport system ATPase component
MTAPVLAVEGLSTGYGSVGIVHRLDLDLQPSSVSVVLGPNGAGKSTTCKAIAGLLPATSGRIVLQGDDITVRPAWWRAQHGIFLAPEGRGIFPGLSVEENLRVLLPAAADRDVIYERFPVLGQRRGVPAGNLSGGEQQMLAIAPMLVHQAAVVIADEPTLGLAPRVADVVLELFAEISRQGAAVLLVGESPQGLVEIASHVSLLHTGRIIWSGPASSLDTETLQAAYFGAAAST